MNFQGRLSLLVLVLTLALGLVSPASAAAPKQAPADLAQTAGGAADKTPASAAALAALSDQSLEDYAYLVGRQAYVWGWYSMGTKNLKAMKYNPGRLTHPLPAAPVPRAEPGGQLAAGPPAGFQPADPLLRPRRIGAVRQIPGAADKTGKVNATLSGQPGLIPPDPHIFCYS